MTPKEKAKELIDKFMPHAYNPNPIFNTNWISEGHHARQIALIAIGEIMEFVPMYTGTLNPKWQFWQDVIAEIKKAEHNAKITDEKEYQP